MLENIKNEFKKKFGSEPLIIKSPGRINLIGEHTDYNEGFVMPAAIDKYIAFALAPGKKDYRFFSLDLNEEYIANPENIKPATKCLWVNYLLGVIAEYEKKGQTIPPFDCVFGGNIPIGAGLSSSAALECGLTLGLSELFGIEIKKEELIFLAQASEHNYAGVLCGIMDQFACTFGKEGHVIKLDCRDMTYDYFPLSMEDYKIVLFDTGVKHSLAGSEYNTRRKECEKGVKIMAAATGNKDLKSLRDCSPDTVVSNAHKLEPAVLNRCLYVTEENERVNKAAIELKQKNIRAVGELMYASHEGLRRKYEVSCPELDFLVDMTLAEEGVLGSRMMGGGFGGCTINLVAKDQVDEVVSRISKVYKEKFNTLPETHIVSLVDGVKTVEL